MMQKWSVGFTFSPDYSFRIPYNTSTASSNISEKGVFAFTSGVHTQLQLSKILALELGVLYTSMGSKVHVPALNAITTGGTYDPSLPYIGQGNYMSIPERKSIYRYRFISIPFKAHVYFINKNKFNMYASVGVSANWLLDRKTTTTFLYTDGHKEKQTDHKYINTGWYNLFPAALLGVGLNYKLNKRWYLKLEHIYRQVLSPLVDNPISGYFYAIRTDVGVSFNF